MQDNRTRGPRKVGRGLAAGLTAVVLAAGCSDDATGPADGASVKLNVFARSGGAAGASVGPIAAGTSAAWISRAGAVTSVEISRVAVVIGSVKLETAGGSTQDFVLEESRVIELDLTGDAVTAVVVDPPAGTYKEVEISVDKLELGNPAEQPLIDEHPELADASVVVEGTVTADGGAEEAFSFATPLDADVEVLLSPFLEVTSDGDGGGVRVFALVIDLDAWFDDGAGGLLDPTDPSDRSAIEAAMGASFDAFEDDDEDGQES